MCTGIRRKTSVEFKIKALRDLRQHSFKHFPLSCGEFKAFSALPDDSSCQICSPQSSEH